MSFIQRTKKIALVDCNSFYVSCERLFNPKIRNKPVVVLSNNDGCIIARSNEAKFLGIKMGEPYFKAKDIILRNNVYVFSSNYSLYGDLSRRVMRTLKRFNPELEIYSVDEAFLDLSNYSDDEVEDIGKEIRSIVLQWTGIPTSIGIAKTKTLSKIANHIAKKKQSGVTNLIGIENIDPLLEKIDINDVWGVGKQLTKFYHQSASMSWYVVKPRARQSSASRAATSGCSANATVPPRNVSWAGRGRSTGSSSAGSTSAQSCCRQYASDASSGGTGAGASPPRAIILQYFSDFNCTIYGVTAVCIY